MAEYDTLFNLGEGWSVIYRSADDGSRRRPWHPLATTSTEQKAWEIVDAMRAQQDDVGILPA